MANTLNCPNGMPYTVKAGDSFFLIARTFGISLDSLLAANPGVNPDRLFIGQVICVPTGTSTPTPSCPAGTSQYTIRSGDTFFILAQRFNTTVDAIMRANPNVNPNNLQIGQVICVPTGTATPTPSCPAGTFQYTIRSGDTFFILAQRFNTTVNAIERANPNVNPNNLQVGQVICIPSRT